MATTSPYPGALPAYPADETDNTNDIIYAIDVNQLRADVRAIAETLGINPAPGGTIASFLTNAIAGKFTQGAQVTTTINVPSTLAHTVVTWPTPVFDFPNSIASVNGNLFVPADGHWDITGNVHYFNTSIQGGGLAQVISASGNTVTRLCGNGPVPFITDGSHDNPQCHSIAWDGYLAAGTRFWLEIAQTSGATTTTFAQLSLKERRLA